MTRTLLLVHGRSQEDRDPDELKAEWVDALRRGLARRGLTLPVPESAIRFPHYGSTLRDLTRRPADEAAEIIVRSTGQDLDPHRARFLEATLREIALGAGAGEDELFPHPPGAVVERGAAQSERMRTILGVLDRRAPGLGGAAIALLVDDVYAYLRIPAITRQIDDGVRAALASSGGPCVVVAHSLGSVVAYRVLRDGDGRNVPLLVTVGSPLGVSTIRRALRPLRHPEGVGRWLNARDVRDLVALHALDAERFPVTPPVEDLATVDNHMPNRHGIAGYLGDPDVAARIHDALCPGGPDVTGHAPGRGPA